MTSIKWRFWCAIALQSCLIAAIPAQAIYTHINGKTVILKTALIDPYDLMRSYPIALNYDTFTVDTLRSLPGYRRDRLTQNSTLFVILQAPLNTSKPSQPWKLVDVSRDRPSNLLTTQIALKGRVEQNDRIKYGLETYYLPENQRNEINQALEQAQRPLESAIKIKVDAHGNAIPMQLWVGDRPYRF